MFFQFQSLLGLEDTPRPSASVVVQALNKTDISSVILTGDNEGSAQIVANRVGAFQWISSMTPRDKYEWIKQEQVL